MVLCKTCREEIKNEKAWKFCSEFCRERYYYLQNIDKRREYQREYYHARKNKKAQWYRKHKRKYRESINKNREKNPESWNARRFVNYHRERLLKRIPNECANCGVSTNKIISHKNLNKLPKRDINKIDEYVKHLVVFCSLGCSREWRRKSILKTEN